MTISKDDAFSAHDRGGSMDNQDIDAACAVAAEIIKNTKAQIEQLFALLPKDRQRPVRLVFLKLDEAILWMREASDPCLGVD